MSRSLTRFFGSRSARQIPGDLGLFVLEHPARHFFGVAGIDLRPGRAGRAKGDSAELQLCRGRPRAFLDQIEREGLGLLVAIVLHDFDTVHDRADRTDEVVTDPRAQQCGEIERFENDRTGHGI